ncbi:retrotransposon protein [Cucumis melo var. makuwa]|uniref:Retrotransposon protein n=1 Tax=Cucumis melo var. makuwa TaxID=1194695 RepID=A0A5D3CCL2_CUCMM|nr:retrotransposon protein [Cucumis melo var. makuwa]
MATPSSQSDLPETSNPIPESSSNPSVSTSTLFLLSNICNLVPIRLDSTNYVLWKYQVSSILKAHSLFGHIDDTLPCPPKHLPSSTLGTNSKINPGYLQWLSRDQALITLINATLSSSALTHVVNSLYHKKKTPSESIDQYTSRIKALVDKLVAASISLEDEEILVHTLNGLPAAFNAFHTSIRTRSATSPLKNFTPFSFRKKQPWPKLQPLKPFQQPWRRFTHLSITAVADEDTVSTPLDHVALEAIIISVHSPITFDPITIIMAHFSHHPTSPQFIPISVVLLGLLLHMGPALGLKQVLDIMVTSFVKYVTNKDMGLSIAIIA